MHILDNRLTGGSPRYAGMNFEGDGTTSVSPPSPPAPPPKQPETFSREYVQELREENKSWRQKLQEAETARQSAAEAAKAAKDEAAAAVKAAKDEAKAEAKAAREEADSKATQRAIRAELRVEATKAGIIDLDVLKLVDTGELKINDKDEVEGAAELIAKLKEAKPYAFKAPRPGSANPEPPPKPGDKTPKTAKDMTDAERAAFLAEHKRKFK